MALEIIAGIELALECTGRGEPTLLFVHGLACDRQDWREQVSALSGRFRIVTFDLPGHGESPAGPTSIEALGRVVCNLTERYGQGGAVLIGHSIGCPIILSALQQAPHEIRGLVFLDGGRVAHGDVDTAVDAFKKKLDAAGVPAFIDAIFQLMFVASSDPALRERILARARKLDRAVAEPMMLSTVRFDAIDTERALSSVKIPVLVLQSTYLDDNYNCRSLEPGMSTAWTQIVTQLVSNATFHVVPGVGHFLMIEAAQTVTDSISDFATDVAADTGSGQ